MKKFCLLLIVFSLFLCSGCELLFDILEMDGSGTSQKKYNYKTKTVETQNDAEIYYVKLNNTSESVSKENTGHASRFAGISENKNDTDRFIQKLNEELNKCLENNYLNNSSRSTTNESAIVKGQNNISYKENDPDPIIFWSYNDFYIDKYGEKQGIPGEVNTICKYAGKYCYVFADQNNNRLLSKGINLLDDDYKKLGRIFDSCYELETSIIGNPFYSEYNSKCFVPCNNKIIILVSDLYGDAEINQQGGTLGYFYQGDLLNQIYLNVNIY